MKRLEQFGSVLAAIMRGKKISSVQLAQKLGYKSHTSVSRILSGEVSRDKANEFMRKLVITNALALNANELRSLKDALELYHVDPSVIYGQEALWQYLFAPETESTQTLCLYAEGHIPEKLDAAAFCEKLQNAEHIEIQIINCCYEGFFSFLSQALYPLEGKCKIDHYIDLTENDAHALHAMICAAMMIRFKQYDGACQSNLTGEKMPAFLTDKAFVWFSDAQGVHLQIIFASANDVLDAYAINNPLQYRCMLDNRLQMYRGHYASMRNGYVCPDRGENLLLLSERLLFMEQDRSQRTYRPALCFNHLPSELIKDEMLDLLGCTLDHPIAQALREVHDKRHQNAFYKKAPTWLVFTIDGMWQLAQSGYLPDHIEGMAPLSLEKRREAFQSLMNAATDNPYFHFHFFDADTRIKRLMLSSHEGLGVYLLDPTTTFSEQEGYFEEILPVESFTNAFNDFFDHMLVQKHSHDEKASRAILADMIAWLAEQQT